ncbi:MAG TPA: deoxyguanosinetriphosphate triphosphohydrolase [Clostridiales bacterium]|nr:deoxyguanosinetriphosphate triphosphohydrolase [Clostridiales bacterium]
MQPRILKEEQEKQLSPYAARSACSLGRQRPEETCTVRTDYERDTGRIIFSMDFRRLRHKTQVFFNPQNDHICTRMEHVIYVNYIANTIGRALNLNADLIQAIALGHDIGHSPFGHNGERTLDRCLKKIAPDMGFQHELHSLRVVDLLSVRPRHSAGLNLTFEVRDGIACHCGESYSETLLVPDRHKKPEDLAASAGRHGFPATLEGCVVRLADKIAYAGRDIEDAARAGIMEYDDLPAAIQSALGRTNGEIINTLVTDIIEHSYGKDAIILSPERGESMEELLRENVDRIYKSDKIRRYEKMVNNVIEGLFDALRLALSDPEKLGASDNRVYRGFRQYIQERAYPEDLPGLQKIVDYIAGMTDSFATKCFEDIYWF